MWGQRRWLSEGERGSAFARVGAGVARAATGPGQRFPQIRQYGRPIGQPFGLQDAGFVGTRQPAAGDLAWIENVACAGGGHISALRGKAIQGMGHSLR